MNLICKTLAIIFAVGCYSQAGLALSVGIYELPPHMIISDGTPQGAIPEFFNKYVFTDSTYKVQWNPAQFARIMADLEYGRLDMAILVAKTKERTQKFLYSEQSLYRTRSGVIVRKDNKLQRIESLHSLNGMLLGHDLGSVVPNYFRDLKVRFNYVSGENYFRRNLSLVRAGRIDGYFVPTWSHGAYELKKGQFLSEFSILEIPAEPLDLYIVFSKNMDPQLIQSINMAINKHRANYTKILSEF